VASDILVFLENYLHTAVGLNAYKFIEKELQTNGLNLAMMIEKKFATLYSTVKFFATEQRSYKDSLAYYDFLNAVDSGNLVRVPLSDEGKALNAILTKIQRIVGIEQDPPVISEMEFKPGVKADSYGDIERILRVYQAEVSDEFLSQVPKALLLHSRLKTHFDGTKFTGAAVQNEAKKYIASFGKDKEQLRRKLYNLSYNQLKGYCRKNPLDKVAAGISEEYSIIFSNMDTLRKLYDASIESVKVLQKVGKSIDTAYSYIKPVVNTSSMETFTYSPSTRMNNFKRASGNIDAILSIYGDEINRIVKYLPKKVQKEVVQCIATSPTTPSQTTSAPPPTVRAIAQVQKEILELKGGDLVDDKVYATNTKLIREYENSITTMKQEIHELRAQKNADTKLRDSFEMLKKESEKKSGLVSMLENELRELRREANMVRTAGRAARSALLDEVDAFEIELQRQIGILKREIVKGKTTLKTLRRNFNTTRESERKLSKRVTIMDQELRRAYADQVKLMKKIDSRDAKIRRLTLYLKSIALAAVTTSSIMRNYSGFYCPKNANKNLIMLTQNYSVANLNFCRARANAKNIPRGKIGLLPGSTRHGFPGLPGPSVTRSIINSPLPRYDAKELNARNSRNLLLLTAGSVAITALAKLIGKKIRARRFSERMNEHIPKHVRTRRVDVNEILANLKTRKFIFKEHPKPRRSVAYRT